LSDDRIASPSPARRSLARVVGWIYLAIGAMFLSAFLAPLTGPSDADAPDQAGEWLPMVLPFLLMFPITFTFAGYRVLRYPVLHRRRTLFFGFFALTCAWLALGALRQMP
jgi:hypothetical protein